MREVVGGVIKTEIQRVRYFPKSGEFRGYVDGSGKIVALTQKWMSQNLNDNFVAEVMRRSQQNGYLKIPPGRVRKEKIDHNLTNKGYPPVHYLQGNDNYCAFYAIASAFHYIGFKRLGTYLFNNAQRDYHKVNSISKITETVIKQCDFLVPKKYKCGKLNIFEDRSDYPTLLVVESSDGSISHAIATVGNWVFDANRSPAQLLTQKTLNWSASSDERACTYIRANQAVRFMEPSNKKKKKMTFVPKYP